MTSSDAQTPEEIVRAANRAFNEKRLDDMMAYHAEDVTQMEPMFLAPLRGRPALRQFLQEVFDAFPDEVVHIDRLLSCGDSVVTETSVTATHRGSFRGNPPTGQPIRLNEVIIWEVRQSKIADVRVYFDTGRVALNLQPA